MPKKKAKPARKPKRREIVHKEVQLSDRARRDQKIASIRNTLQQLDELEDAYLAKLEAEGRDFVEERIVASR